jgi:hypothetical protein
MNISRQSSRWLGFDGACAPVGAMLLACSLSQLFAQSPAGPPPSNLPDCAHAQTVISLPPEFPKVVPLPPGTVFTSSRPREGGITMIGVVPMELSQAARFFIAQLPAAGFQLGRGESESGEAEAPFRGNGIMGGFQLRTMVDCPGVLQLVITVQKK